MSDFTHLPQRGAQAEIAPRVRKATFGDGYIQRVADGINNKPEVWNLAFKGEATVAAVDTQLRGYGGVTSFTWTNPLDVEIRVICSAWRRVKGTDMLTATFEQVFES